MQLIGWSNNFFGSKLAVAHTLSGSGCLSFGASMHLRGYVGRVGLTPSGYHLTCHVTLNLGAEEDPDSNQEIS